MEKILKTYYDFAENDYLFFKTAYINGRGGNAMGAMAQSICEKYLKHIIDIYIEPNNGIEASLKRDNLRSHNLKKLEKYISENVEDIYIDKSSLIAVDGLYFTTRYPGDESFFVEKADVDEYVAAVEQCKNDIDAFIAQRENPDKLPEITKACDNTQKPAYDVGIKKETEDYKER